MLNLPILSINLLIPLIGVLLIAPTSNKRYAEYITIFCSSINLAIAIYCLMQFEYISSTYQFVERYNWIEAIGLELYLGIDGISVYLIFLTALLSLLCILFSIFTITYQVKEYLICFLLLEFCCIGAFSSLNLLLFYFFFEAILIPMYLIIGIWGGENRIYAAMKFFLYTFLGSVFFLLAVIYIYINAHSFDIPFLINVVSNFSYLEQELLWLAIFIGFAVKVPMFPLHTWLPEAHVQAPTTGSVILAGILLKLGAYGFLRISLPMLPYASQEFAIYILSISVFAIIYASLVAIAQQDMKKMIAYSSVAHMGYVTAGIFTFTESGIAGAIFQMLSHGVISAALFFTIGILYERGHSKLMSHYSGVASKMPNLAVLLMITLLGSIGLPGTSGFIGEFLSLVGIMSAEISLATFAAAGIIFSALYMLRFYRAVMFGETNENVAGFKDLKIFELISLLTLSILIIFLGLMPSYITKIIDSPVRDIVQLYK